MTAIRADEGEFVAAIQVSRMALSLAVRAAISTRRQSPTGPRAAVLVEARRTSLRGFGRFFASLEAGVVR
jgi:hypothetical protein